MIKYLYEIIAAKRYTYTDEDVGDLRRVGGYWRIEQPNKTLGVSVKIIGSDRFGPNKRALKRYKIYRNEFESIWNNAINAIRKTIEHDQLKLGGPAAEYIPLEIIFVDPKDSSCDMAIAFSITTVDHNEFAANFDKLQFKGFESMY